MRGSVSAHKASATQVGLTHGQTAEEWLDEIQTAQAAGIDGFALNIGPSDPWSEEQLGLAYTAAAQFSGSFVLFLSFDMAAGEWSVSQVISLITALCDSLAQCKVDGGLPLVSTFEGPGWAENWAAVREGVPGGIFLVPDWSSLGPEGLRPKLEGIEGAFSWCAWPRAGEKKLGTEEDEAYARVLRRKQGKEGAYMMGVSPWFYTSKSLRSVWIRVYRYCCTNFWRKKGLPQWNKNWHSSGESLWYDRWRQIWQVKPRFVQIITCGLLP